MISVERIEEGLGEKSPWHIYAFDTVGSTMTEAQRLAEAGKPEFSVAIADCQTAGSGRFHRVWHSPAGEGLWMTTLLRPALVPDKVALLTLMSAVSIAEALDDMGFSVGIKWPNDVLAAQGEFARRKICGIRAEMSLAGDKVSWASLGIGINVGQQSFPQELSHVAVSLHELGNASVTREECAVAVLARLESNYRTLLSDGFARIRRSWLDRAIGLGEPVSIKDVDGEVCGIAKSIDEEGRLLIDVAGEGVKTIISGDLVFQV